MGEIVVVAVVDERRGGGGAPSTISVGVRSGRREPIHIHHNVIDLMTNKKKNGVEMI